jgi:hypothetical protein
MNKNTKASLAYPRALVRLNSAGYWAMDWRFHPDEGNHWDAPMAWEWYALLPVACDRARGMVDHLWADLGRGDGA